MHNNKIVKKIISHLQKMINRDYERYGLTDSVFKNQLKLNEFKAKYNVVIDEEIITDDGFLQ